MEAITLEELIEMKDELEAEKSKYKWYYEMYIQVENLSKGSPSLRESLESYTEGYLRYMELNNAQADVIVKLRNVCKHKTFVRIRSIDTVGEDLCICKICNKRFSRSKGEQNVKTIIL